MKHPNIAHLRVLRQRIAGAKCVDPAAAVRWMGALQAQDYGQAMWAVGLRTRVPALADRQLVLTWPMRGTWCRPKAPPGWCSCLPRAYWGPLRKRKT